jgi:hypothetical protein
MISTGDSPEDQTLALPITINWVGLDGEINVLRIKEAAEPVSPRLLSGDDLRGLPGRVEPGQHRPGDAVVLDDEIFQVSA